MMNWDLPGWDYFSVPNIREWSECQVACNNDGKCVSWTFVKDREINNNCFLKSGIPFLTPNSVCVSGVKPVQNERQVVWVYVNRTLSQKNPDAARGIVHAPLWLEYSPASDRWMVVLDIFIDHSVIEVFESDSGRLAITTRVYPEEVNANNFAVYVANSMGNIELGSTDFWNLTAIWT